MDLFLSAFVALLPCCFCRYQAKFTAAQDRERKRQKEVKRSQSEQLSSHSSGASNNATSPPRPVSRLTLALQAKAQAAEHSRAADVQESISFVENGALMGETRDNGMDDDEAVKAFLAGN